MIIFYEKKSKNPIKKLCIMKYLASNIILYIAFDDGAIKKNSKIPTHPPKIPSKLPHPIKKGTRIYFLRWKKNTIRVLWEWRELNRRWKIENELSAPEKVLRVYLPPPSTGASLITVPSFCFLSLSLSP